MSTTLSGCKLVLQRDASTAGCDRVRQWLREHNWAVNGAFMQKLQQPEHAAAPLVLLAETDAGKVVGGLVAETQLAWLRIGIMAVEPQCRSQGVGAALLAEAERIARERACRHAHVDTMSCQAPGFYLRQGYRIVGELPDWDSHGHAKLHMIKDISRRADNEP